MEAPSRSGYRGEGAEPHLCWLSQKGQESKLVLQMEADSANRYVISATAIFSYLPSNNIGTIFISLGCHRLFRATGASMPLQFWLYMLFYSYYRQKDPIEVFIWLAQTL